MSRLRFMKQGLKELLFSGRQKRIEQLETVIENDKEYVELIRQEHALYEQLMTALPVNMIPVLIKYSDTLNDVIILQEKFFYTQEARDCARTMFMLSDEQIRDNWTNPP